MPSTRSYAQNIPGGIQCTADEVSGTFEASAHAATDYDRNYKQMSAMANAIKYSTGNEEVHASLFDRDNKMVIWASLGSDGQLILRIDGADMSHVSVGEDGRLSIDVPASAKAAVPA